MPHMLNSYQHAVYVLVALSRRYILGFRITFLIYSCDGRSGLLAVGQETILQNNQFDFHREGNEIFLLLFISANHIIRISTYSPKTNSRIICRSSHLWEI